MNLVPKNISHIHFIGIGGIGMSGIAEILNTLGYEVRGSDLKDGANVERLRKQGVHISIGHKADQIYKDDAYPSAVVVSSAVKDNNPELVEARASRIPVVRRAEMLAELMRLKRAVAIGGTHGKTTTTSMVGQMLDTAGFDPTIINGGIVNAYGTNTRFGDGEWMVVEADESDGTFTRLPASVAVVTNMDAEHMEHYGSFENVRKAYKTFIRNLPFYGYAVLCIDHPEVQALIPRVSDRRVITYGFSPQADVHVMNVKTSTDGSTFDVRFSEILTGDEPMVMRDIFLPVLGMHNVQNSLAALAIAYEMDVPVPLIKKGLASFTGVKRRFTRTGVIKDITIIDDYAHHPVEIETVLKTARLAVDNTGGRVIAVMQPHRFTRLHDLFEEFAACFNNADTVIITDVYTAGEDPIKGICGDSLVKAVQERGHRDARKLNSSNDLVSMIADIGRPGDYLVCLGAGDITAWANALPADLEKELQNRENSAA